jgi:hypothetical protein
VDALPAYYDTERLVTLIGEDDETATATVNKFDPAKQAIVENNITHGKFAVTVDAGPSYQTKRVEAVASQMEFLKVFPQAAPIIGDVIAKNMDWPGNEEIVDRLRIMLPPPIQGLLSQKGKGKPLPPEAQQQIAQLTGQLEQGKQAFQALQAELEQEKMGTKAKTDQAAIAGQQHLDETLITSAASILTTAVDEAIKVQGGSVDAVTGIPIIRPITPEEITALTGELTKMVQAMRGPDPQTAAFAAIGQEVNTLLHASTQPRVLQIENGADGLASGGSSTPMPPQGPPPTPPPTKPHEIMAALAQVKHHLAKPKHVIAAHHPQTGAIVGGVAMPAPETMQ